MAGLNHGPAQDDDNAVLEALRERSAGLKGPATGADWQRQVRALYRRGISIETALQFLYAQRPDRQAFQAWLLEYGRSQPADPGPSTGEDDGAHDGTLSAAQWECCQAGDFILWHQALPHCATPSCGALPHKVQYLTCLPGTIEHQTQWI